MKHRVSRRSKATSTTDRPSAMTFLAQRNRRRSPKQRRGRTPRPTSRNQDKGAAAEAMRRGGWHRGKDVRCQLAWFSNRLTYRHTGEAKLSPTELNSAQTSLSYAHGIHFHMFQRRTGHQAQAASGGGLDLWRRLRGQTAPRRHSPAQARRHARRGFQRAGGFSRRFRLVLWAARTPCPAFSRA